MTSATLVNRVKFPASIPSISLDLPVKILGDKVQNNKFENIIKVENVIYEENLSHGFYEEISKTKISNKYKKGQTLFYEGNNPYGVYFIKSGKVKLSKHAPDGKEFIIKIANKGELIGYSSLFTKDPYTCTAEIIEDTNIIFIEKERFFELIKIDPEFSLKLLEIMGKDIGYSEHNSTNIAYLSANERIVELLLSLNEKFGIEQENGTFKIDVLLSREQLARMLGTSTETAVRLLTWLKEKNILEIKQKYTFITNLSKLKALVPHY